MIRVDEDKIFATIKKYEPNSVALSGPDTLMHKIQICAKNISQTFNIPVYIIGDNSWGSCDLNTHAADMLGADILFNIGHFIAMDSFGHKVVMINAYDDVDFTPVAIRCAKHLKNKNIATIGLLTSSQHLSSLAKVKDIFEEYGYTVIIGGKKGQLNDGQVFGCEFYPAYDVRELVDVYVFLGQSVFHSVGIAIATQKPTFMLDPYFEEFSDVTSSALELQRKAILSVYRSMDAKNIGIIIGLKEGQFAKVKALDLKKTFEKLGKNVELIAMNEVTEDRIKIFSGIDAFIQVACPRISLDNYFEKPMLSVPQALSLAKLLKHERVENFMEARHWL